MSVKKRRTINKNYTEKENTSERFGVEKIVENGKKEYLLKWKNYCE